MRVTLVADVDGRSDVELEGLSTAFKQYSIVDVVVFPSALERRWRGVSSVITESGRWRGMLRFPSVQVCSTEVRWLRFSMVGVTIVVVPCPGGHPRGAGNDGLGRNVLSRRQDRGVVTRIWWRVSPVRLARWRWSVRRGRGRRQQSVLNVVVARWIVGHACGSEGELSSRPRRVSQFCELVLLFLTRCGVVQHASLLLSLIL
jgi:hypothetical protein